MRRYAFTLATLLLISFLYSAFPLKTRAEVQGEGQASCGPAIIYSKARSKPWTTFEVKVSLTILIPLSGLYSNFFPLFFSLGKQIIFVTNNSTKSRADYQKKLQAMGIPAEVVRALLPSFLPPSSSISPSSTSTQMSNQTDNA